MLGRHYGEGADGAFAGEHEPSELFRIRALGKVGEYRPLEDARTYENQTKVGGKPTVLTRITISADGKTLTATQSGTNVQGQAVKNVIVADKQ